MSKSNKSNKQQSSDTKSKSNLLWNLVIAAAVFTMILAGCALVKSLWEYHEGSREYDTLAQAVKKGAGVQNGSDTDGAEEEKRTEEGANSSTDAAEENASSLQPIVTPFQEIDFAYLQKQNPDTVGWLEIPGTVIDYPIMQGEDNAYYLTHTFSRKENKAGSIFAEGINHADLQDAHTIIYGHNMKNGSMFGTLKRYRDGKYLKIHPYIYLYTPEHTYKYEIFSCYEVAQDSPVYTVWYEGDEAFGDFVKQLQKSSIHNTDVSVSGEDKIITLSTCVSIETNRFVVHARRIK